MQCNPKDDWTPATNWQRIFIARILEIQPTSVCIEALKKQVDYLYCSPYDEEGCLNLKVGPSAVAAPCSGMVAQARYPDVDTESKSLEFYGRYLPEDESLSFGPHITVMLFVNLEGYMYAVEFHKDDGSPIINREPTPDQLRFTSLM